VAVGDVPARSACRDGPEISDEEIVRAMLVVRADTMQFEAASPPLTQRLLDMLNERITPVVLSRGTIVRVIAAR
jgi:histidine ammonia-lyase